MSIARFADPDGHRTAQRPFVPSLVCVRHERRASLPPAQVLDHVLRQDQRYGSSVDDPVDLGGPLATARDAARVTFPVVTSRHAPDMTVGAAMAGFNVCARRRDAPPLRRGTARSARESITAPYVNLWSGLDN